MRWISPRRTSALAAVALLAAAAGPAAGQSGGAAPGTEVRALALPTRSDPGGLAARAGQVADALAARLGLPPARTAAPADPIDPELDRGLELAASGALDDAALALDRALDRGARAPDRIADPRRFITAQVSRIAIALARSERERAERLADRLLGYDPAFQLAPAEDSPRVRRALDQARRRAGDPPPLTVALLGRACRGDAPLLVARGLPSGAVEYARFERCRLVARVEATGARPPAEIAAALDPRAAPPARGDRPLHRRPWVWIAIGAGVVAGSAAIYLGTRGSDELDIVPHF